MIMEVQVISREAIKPPIPTLEHLRTIRLSSLDPPQVYLPIIFFYSGDSIKTTENFLRLKNFLSETLTCFYTLAGRIKNGYVVECNDKGVDFFDARVNGQLAQFLQHPNNEVLSQLLPCNYYSARSGNDVLLAVQVNTFDYGGMAIRACIFHTMGDGSSLATFVNAWVSTARGSSEIMNPSFPSTSLFPLKEPSGLIQLEQINNKVAPKSFIFDGSKIEMLRARDPMVASDKYPTRVESVSALVWWCAMRARADEGVNRPSVVVHEVSLRGRMVPPLPDYSFGNIVAPVVAESEGPQDTQRWLELRSREAISTIDGDYIKELQSSNGLVWPSLSSVPEKYCKTDVDSYGFTSWCRFPLYDADFGGGKPVWVSSGSFPKNCFVLMGTRSGEGIEVWANMVAEEMIKFEQDEELLAFASPHAI